jgi:uncharacterized membrane protein YfcA
MLALYILGLAFLVSLLSGLVGLGGGIVMTPALVYLSPLVGIAPLDFRLITGLTTAQALFAGLSGSRQHDNYQFVHRRLALWMGISILPSALLGATLSKWMSVQSLVVIFALMAIIAAVLMWLPHFKTNEERVDANSLPFSPLLAVALAVPVGLLGGMVGQGGSFILIPLMYAAFRLPTRVVIGTNLMIVMFSALAGFIGKAATGQMPFALAAFLVLGALPGAHIGSILSRRAKPKILRLVLALLIAATGVKMALGVFF